MLAFVAKSGCNGLHSKRETRVAESTKHSNTFGTALPSFAAGVIVGVFAHP